MAEPCRVGRVVALLLAALVVMLVVPALARAQSVTFDKTFTGPAAAGGG